MESSKENPLNKHVNRLKCLNKGNYSDKNEKNLALLK